MATLDDLMIGLGTVGLRDLRSDFDQVTRFADRAVDDAEQAFETMDLEASTDGVRSDLARVDALARRAVDDAEAQFDRLRPDFPGVEAGADDAVGGAVSSFKGLGGPLAIAAGVAGGAAGAALVGEFMDAVENEQLEDRLAAQLDLTVADAERYGQLASDLYAGAWGESLGHVHDAIDAVDSTLGDLSMDELEELTVHALDLEAAFGEDVTEAVHIAGVMMRTGMARDGEQAFDLLVQAMQSVPRAMRGELLPIIEEYAQDFEALGIDGPDALGLIVEAARDGRYEMDKTGDSLKELTIRATDMSDATQTAYDTLGLNAREMTEDLLAGGEQARTAFDQIIDGLIAIDDPAERANTAIALLGTPLEDLSVTEIPAFLERLDQMGGKFGDAEGAADRFGDTLNTNVGTDIESFKRRASTAIDEWVEDNVLPNAAKVIDAFEEDGIGGALSTAVDLWHDAQPEVQAWWDGTFTPWWEDTAVPWMKYLGGEMGTALINGVIEGAINSIPSLVSILDQFDSSFGGAFGGLDLLIPDDLNIDVQDIENPVPRPQAPERTYNPDRTSITGGRTVSAATGTQTINVTNYYPEPASTESTSESMRRGALEFT